MSRTTKKAASFLGTVHHAFSFELFNVLRFNMIFFLWLSLAISGIAFIIALKKKNGKAALGLFFFLIAIGFTLSFLASGERSVDAFLNQIWKSEPSQEAGQTTGRSIHDPIPTAAKPNTQSRTEQDGKKRRLAQTSQADNPAETTQQQDLATGDTADHIDLNPEPEQDQNQEHKVIRVLNADQSPAPGATLLAYGLPDALPPLQPSDQDGYLTVPINHRTTNLYLYAQNFDGSQRTPIITLADETITLADGREGYRLILEPAVVIQAYLTDKNTQKPIAGSNVSATVDNQRAASVLTDETGTATLSVPPGQIRLFAGGGNYSPATREFTADPGPMEVSFELDRQFILSGQVTDLEGNPIQNAGLKIVFNNGGMSGNHTDRNGNYRYELSVPPPWRTIVSKDGYAQIEEQVDLESGTYEGTWNFTLEEEEIGTMTVSGLVRDSNGNPLADVNVQIGFRPGPGPSTRTDSEGRFRFTEIPDTLEQQLHFQHATHYGAATHFTLNEYGEAQVEVQLPKTITLSGTIIQNDGTPYVGECQFNFHKPENQPDPQPNTEYEPFSVNIQTQDGTFSFTAPENAVIYLNNYGTPRIKKGPFSESQSNLVWKLENDTLTAYISDAETNKPITSFVVSRDIDGDGHICCPKNHFNEEGLLTIDQNYSSNRPITLMVCAEGFSCKEVKVPAKANMPLSIKLPRSHEGDIRGQVVNQNSIPLAGITVHALYSTQSPDKPIGADSLTNTYHDPNALFTEKTDENGRFHFRNLNAGYPSIAVWIQENQYIADFVPAAQVGSEHLTLVYKPAADIQGNLNPDTLGYVNYLMLYSLNKYGNKELVGFPVQGNRYEKRDLRNGYYRLEFPTKNRGPRAFKTFYLKEGESKTIDLGYEDLYSLLMFLNKPKPGGSALLLVKDSQGEKQVMVPIERDKVYYSHNSPAEIWVRFYDHKLDPDRLPNFDKSQAQHIQLNQTYLQVRLP